MVTHALYQDWVMVTSAQLRAARSLLNWTVRDLSEKAAVHRNTITRAETDATAHGHAVAQVVRTLESAGVIFVEENGEGPGVRMRKRKPGDIVRAAQVGQITSISVGSSQNDFPTTIKVAGRPSQSPKDGVTIQLEGPDPLDDK
jgi:hypothetical protein